MIRVLILFFLFSHLSYGEDLYSSVFGDQSYEAEIETYINKTGIGDLLFKVQGEELKGIHAERLQEKLKLILKESVYKRIKFKDKWIAPSDFPYSVEFDPQSLKVIIYISYDSLIPQFQSMDNNPEIKYAGLAIEPAPLSGGVSLNSERRVGDEYFGGDYESLYYDSFINIKGFVFESRGFYQNDIDTDQDAKWFQGNKSLTKDFKDQRLRVRVGDTQNLNFGFLNSYQVGGISFNRQFSINPYNRPFPQGQEEFQLYTRSQVKTYVNGNLIKDEFLPAGNYRFDNLPLINGLNFVRVEIIDELGEKRVLEYDLPTSISLLAQGEDNFSFVSGKPFNDVNLERTYEESNLSSAFYQRGINYYYTLGGYAQNYESFNLIGLSNGVATSNGNIFYELAHSQHADDKGSAHSLTYQFQLQGRTYFSGFSSLLRYENYQNQFSQGLTLPNQFIKESVSLNISAPVLSELTVNVGGGLATYQDLSLDKREQFNFSANWRINRSLNINFYSTRTNNFSGDEVLSNSVFLTWNFDESKNYLNIYRDIENKQSRLTVVHDNNNELYHPLVNVNVDMNEEDSEESGTLNVQVPTPMADISLRGSFAQTDQGNQSLQSIRLGSSLLFAYSDQFAYAISRPNANSFALFKVSENIEDQELSLRSTSPYADTSTPILGDLSLTNLVAYQYREVEVNTLNLDEGISLEREKFVLYPTYKSAHLIELKDKGLLTLKGQIIYNGENWGLKIGSVNGKVFFTDRDGNFFIEGIQSDKLLFKVEEVVYSYQLNESKRGIMDIGQFEINGK